MRRTPPASTVLRRRAVAAALAIAGVAIVLAVVFGAGRSGPRDRPPTLEDLWAGRASLVLDRKLTSTSLGRPNGGAAEGAHIEVDGSTWYLFNRRNGEGECPGRPGFGPLATQVRTSEDRGATWSAPTDVVGPTAGTPWSCAATDGDVVHEPGSDRWRYLFQCLGDGGGWNGCLVERRGRSPVGPWSAPKEVPNPVLVSEALWRRVCDPGDDCHRPPGERPVGDEGTFDAFPAAGGAWWVGFHGYDGKRGYRGLARTESFKPSEWRVDGEDGTPTDATFDAADAAGWRETWAEGGPIGAGAARVLEEGDRHYAVVEMPDVDLACKAGQSWDLGLMRTPDLASSRWEQLPAGNPVVYSSRAKEGGDASPPCNVIYPGLFRDPGTGTTYLMHGRVAKDPAQDGIYLFRLEWDRNELRNGDFRAANADGWRAFPGTTTQLAVERSTPTALDGSPDLVFNCGASTCAPEASVLQDVEVPERLRGRTVAFGGAFRGSEAPGELTAALLQLDGDGEVLRSAELPVQATMSYTAVRRKAKVHPRARRLRFQLFPRSTGTLRADDLFVIDQDDCRFGRFPAC